jgi:hypothetical protein
VSRDTFDDAGWKQVLRRGPIKDPIVFVDEIGKTCAFAHVQTNGGFFDLQSRRRCPGLASEQIEVSMSQY